MIIDTIGQQLTGQVYSDLYSMGLNIPNSTLKSIVTASSAPAAILINQTISDGFRSIVDTSPETISGDYNPIDVTNFTASADSIIGNTLNVLVRQHSSTLTASLVNSVISGLRLSALSQQGVNFDVISASLMRTSSYIVESSIEMSLRNSISDILTKIPYPAQPFVPLLTGTSAGAIPGLVGAALSQTMGELTNSYQSAIATKYLDQAKAFDVSYENNYAKLNTQTAGFIDPTANYPTPDYSGKSETNRLAQGDYRGTIVEEKNNTKMVGAKLPNGQAWDQPVSPFKGEYPYNKVTHTESGHIIEIDDTPGSERIHLYHRSGTFVEIDANGSTVMRTKGSKYEIIDRNGKIAITGSADISVNGACNIFVGNDSNIEVEGNTNIICHNDITVQAGGKFNLSAAEEFNITSGNVNIEAYYAMNVKSNVALIVSATDDLSLRSNANAYVQSTVLYQNTTNYYNQAIESMYEKTGNSRYSQAGEEIHFLSTGKCAVDGEFIYLNSGETSLSRDSKSANVAGPSNIGILLGMKYNPDPDIDESILTPERRHHTDNSIDDPVALTMADPYALRLEESLDSNSENIEKHKNLLLNLGLTTLEDFERKGIKIESVEVSSDQGMIIIPDIKTTTKAINLSTTLPGNFNLSHNFTVEMLSSKATLTKCFIVGDDKTSYADIIHNLSAIALNILEPTYNIFPQMTVASGFRTKDISSANSLHPTGKCVDIQFKGATREEYYKNAKQLAKVLNYDQFILHYCNYTSSPWIHISFNTTGNNKEVKTYWNNNEYSSGLVLLK